MFSVVAVVEGLAVRTRLGHHRRLPGFWFFALTTWHRTPTHNSAEDARCVASAGDWHDDKR